MRGAVIAAVSGGPNVTKVVDRAIAIAKQERAPLWIVHVVDGDFLRGRAHMPRSTEESLEHLGELLLERARQQAAKAGLDAGTELLEGPLVERLGDVVRKTRATTIVIGERKHTFLATRHDWADLVEETGVSVVRAT